MSSKINPDIVNVGLRLSATAKENPHGAAVVEPLGRDARGRRLYRVTSFRELEEESNRIANGLRIRGFAPGKRLVLLVRPSLDFISLVFAMFKAGAITVLIDPGMGRRNLVRCLSEVGAEGFVAIPPVHAIRTLRKWRFRKARHNVTVGRRWFWGGATLEQLRRTKPASRPSISTLADDPAAIIFTTGSTGPPKGVLYSHGNFDRQVEEIREHYGIQRGEVDVAGFPLFALFDAAMGVTTIIPDMDFTRPADVDPRNIVEPANDWSATQAFGSPALWNVVGRYCEERQVRLSTVRRVLSAGAPVPAHVLQRMKQAIPEDGDVFTPYGATEALPVASVSATEVLDMTAEKSDDAAGTCVGTCFPGIEWKVLRIRDDEISRFDQAEEMPNGEIGELVVRGPVVTQRYVTREESNPLHKIQDGPATWHRMGDVGYLDASNRFWFCGRKSQRVQTPTGPHYTVPCEAIFNQHPRVYRSALVGVGPAEEQRPVMIVELWPEHRTSSRDDRKRLIDELLTLGRSHSRTESIETVLIHDKMPVDIRHNAKIFREQLAVWAARRVT